MKVAVIRGGRSSEHEVSLRSGSAVAAGLREAGHETVDVVIEPDGRWLSGGAEVELRAAAGLLGCDAAFPVLHGPFGEDGTVQGLLECLDVPYVGPGVLAAAVTIDKLVFAPAEVNAKVGDTVEWVNKDALAHTATASNGDWNVVTGPKQSGRVVLKKAGAVDYFCKYHPNMKGRVVVAP